MNLLTLAIAVAISLRLAVAAAAWNFRGASAFLVPDSDGYLALSASLASRFTFNQLNQVELFRTPVYPLLLIPGVIVGYPVLYAVVFQAFVTAAIVALTYATARAATLEPRTSAACALFVAVEPTLMVWALRVMPETALTFCLLGFAWTTLRMFAAPNRALGLLAGVFLAAAAYTKPVAYPLIFIVFAGGIVYSAWRRDRRMWQAVLVCGLTSLSLVGAWQIRNYRMTGYAGFSTLFDRALYISASGGLESRAQGIPFEDVRTRLYERVNEFPADAPKRYDVMRRAGWSAIRHQPVQFLGLHLQGVVRTTFDPGGGEWVRLLATQGPRGGVDKAIREGLWAAVNDLMRSKPNVLWLSIALSPFVLAVTVLPIVAMTRLAAPQRPAFVFMMLVAVYFLVAGGGAPGMSRFRSPVIPLLVVMSGFALPVRTRVSYTV